MIFNTALSSLFYTQNKNEAASNSSIEKLLWVVRAERISFGGRNGCRGEQKPGELLLVAVEQGTLCVESAEVQGKLFGGQMLLIPYSDCACRLAPEGAGSCLVLSVSGTFLEPLIGGCVRRSKRFCPSALPDLLELIQVLEEEDSEPEHISAAVYRLLAHVRRIAEVYREQTGWSPLVEIAVGIIEQDFAYLDGVDELADRLGVTSNHFIRLFSEAVGMPPGRYLKLRRIAYAKSLLVQPEMTVSLAADLSGFSGSNYFAKVFRREVGMSPRDYAAAYRLPEADDTVQRLIDESYL